MTMPSYVLQTKGFWDVTTRQLIIITEVPQELATYILFLDFPENEGRTLLTYVNKYLLVDINSHTRRLDTTIRNTISHFSTFVYEFSLTMDNLAVDLAFTIFK
jgi:hypothetical protein